MRDGRLPRELERLECVLLGGPRPEPSPALRQRVLDGVRNELPSKSHLLKWQFALAFAATFLMSVILSAAVVHAAGIVLRQHEACPSIRDAATQLQEFSEELSQEEAIRRVTLLRIAAEVGCRTELSDRLGIR